MYKEFYPSRFKIDGRLVGLFSSYGQTILTNCHEIFQSTYLVHIYYLAFFGVLLIFCFGPYNLKKESYKTKNRKIDNFCKIEPDLY